MDIPRIIWTGPLTARGRDAIVYRIVKVDSTILNPVSEGTFRVEACYTHDAMGAPVWQQASSEMANLAIVTALNELDTALSTAALALNEEEEKE